MTVQSKPRRTGRGLAAFDAIVDRVGAELTLVESSERVDAYVWVAVAEQPSVEHPGGREAAAHLTLNELQSFRDQIDWMLVNHQQAT